MQNRLDVTADLVSDRRRLHQHPEPAWCEFRTASYVVEALERSGIEVAFGRKVVDRQSRLGLPSEDTLARYFNDAVEGGARLNIVEAMRGGFTGVVASVRGRLAGPTIAVRMDMDANLGLESDAPGHYPADNGFRSRNDGVHHNCGHDGHTAIGLALARKIWLRRDELHGHVKFIFQPAEEGLRGARAMVAADVLDGVDLFFGFHIGVQALQNGEVIAGYRNILASSKLNARFTGTPAHAGISPHIGRNALLAAAIATQALLAIPRHGQGDTRINVGKLSGGESRNTIPSSASLELEVRADSTEVLAFLEGMAERAILGAAQTQDVEVAIERCGYSNAGNSDADLTDFVAEIIRRDGSSRNVRRFVDYKGSDDAAVMMQTVQASGGRAVYMGFGSPLAAVHHNPRFEFDEKVLPFGVEILESILLEAHKFRST